MSIEETVKYLEREEIPKINSTIHEMAMEQVGTKCLVERFIDLVEGQSKTNEKQSETLDAMKLVLFELTDSIKDSTKVQVELAKQVEKIAKDTNDRFEEQEKKIQEVDDKTKIDVAVLQKESMGSNIKKYLLGGGVVGLIVVVFEIISRFI